MKMVLGLKSYKGNTMSKPKLNVPELLEKGRKRKQKAIKKAYKHWNKKSDAWYIKRMMKSYEEGKETFYVTDIELELRKNLNLDNPAIERVFQERFPVNSIGGVKLISLFETEKLETLRDSKVISISEWLEK